MLFLTRWFGVTGSDADRDFAREHSDIEEITKRSLCCSRTLPPNNIGNLRGELTPKVSAPEPSSKYWMLPQDAILSWRRGSRRGCSRGRAYILRSCDLGTRIRTRILISRPMFDRCLSPSTSLGMARRFLTRTSTARISQCKTQRLYQSMTRRHFSRS